MPLPDSISLIQTPTHASFLLPPRNLGYFRLLCFIPLLFLIIPAAFLTTILVPFINSLFPNHPPIILLVIAAVVLILFLSMLIPGFRAPYTLFLFALALLFPTRTEIRITADSIADLEHVGPFFITALKRKRASIQNITVASAGITPTSTRFASIQLLPSPDSKQKDFAPVYPRELLIPLASAISEQLALADPDAILRAAPVNTSPIPVTIQSETPASDPDETTRLLIDRHISPEPAPELPPKSKITCIPESNLLTFVLPRTGFRGTALFFLIFSAGWNALSLSIFIAMLVSYLHDHAIETLGILAFLSIFVAIGLLTAALAIQYAFQKSVIVAAPDTLVITQSGPFRKSEFQWPARELTDIRTGPSGTSINNQPVPELQIHSTTRKKSGFFDGRPPEDLHYLAATLRNFYMRKN